jgi:hypothetical protein
MMRGQWFDYGQPAVAGFRAALQNGTPPDSVQLLFVRARALLERGAFRSAVIEASAALETALTRKIQQSLTVAGFSAARISAELKARERFGDRAKSLLKKATGTSAATLDGGLWQRVLQQRDHFRHGVAHSDLEPTKQNAEKAIDDFAKLARLIEQIP